MVWLLEQGRYMKQRWIQGIGLAGRHPGLVSGWLFSGAFLGLLIGLFEAWLLWTRLRMIPLLVPDVGYVVWFLAPLIDMAFFAEVGLGLGWLAVSFWDGQSIAERLPVARENRQQRRLLTTSSRLDTRRFSRISQSGPSAIRRAIGVRGANIDGSSRCTRGKNQGVF